MSIANTPLPIRGKYVENKTERLVRQVMSDAHMGRRHFTKAEADKLFKITGQARHEAHEAAVALLSLGTPDQQRGAQRQAFIIASTKTDDQRLYALLSLSYAKDPRWKSIAASIPEPDSGYECAQALLKQAD